MDLKLAKELVKEDKNMDSAKREGSSTRNSFKMHLTIFLLETIAKIEWETNKIIWWNKVGKHLQHRGEWEYYRGGRKKQGFYKNHNRWF